MDEQLAAIYGTNQSTEYYEEDQEKLAAAELLVKLAEDEGVDLNDFSDDEIAEMVSNLYENDSYGEESEKVAEADFLGRVMAHAYMQELGEIEKTSGIKEWIAPKAKAVMEHLERVGKKVGGKRLEAFSGRAGKEHARHRLSQIANLNLGSKEREKALKQRLMQGTIKEMKHATKKEHSRLGRLAGGAVYGGGALATGGAGYGAYKGLKHLQEKNSAAEFDKIAEDRAIEMLYDQGWIDAEGNLLYAPQEKVASVDDIEIRALQMLEETGFPVNWA